MQSTTGGTLSSEVLKRDKRGRIWTRPEQREALLDEFEKSGMSGAQFVRLTGVNYSSFQNWVQRRRHSRGAQMPATQQESATTAGPAAVRLFEAVVPDGERAQAAPVDGLPRRGVAGLLIELPGGSRMRLETPVQLRMAAELLALIAQSARA